MKRKPATPLPWEANHGCIDTLADNVPALATVRDCANGEQDAKYIAHAANAYPKLVDELRAAANYCAFAAKKDTTRRSAQYLARAEMARGLLRELGEKV